MLLEEKIIGDKKLFIAKLLLISSELKIKAEWGMIMFNNESGLEPTKQNKQGATGIQQIMPRTAIQLGTTKDKIKLMSSVEQLDLFRKYFLPFKGRIHSLEDLYTINFFPIALGKPDDWVCETKKLSAWLIADQNKPFDLNKDHKITIGEFRKYIRIKFQKYKQYL